MRTTWREADFQKWLADHPVLPGIGELFLVRQAGPLERFVDMLFISADGALVLVEVKNERTSREIIGQALEYAARFQNATLEEVAEAGAIDCDKLVDAFRQRFNRAPTLSSTRHIVFVAPEFDVTCLVTVPYMRHLAVDKDVQFHLVRAACAACDVASFNIEQEDEPTAASQMTAGSCGVSQRGTLYVVLKAGVHPVLWRVGGIQDGKIVSPRKLRTPVGDRLLRPLPESPAELDIAESGDCWIKRVEPQKMAIVLGVFHDPAKGDTYHLVRLRAGRFENVRRKSATELHDDWTREATDQFDWATLRGLTATGADGAIAEEP